MRVLVVASPLTGHVLPLVPLARALRDAGQTIELRVLGLATVADDVTPELATATIAAVEVLGAFRAPRAVKAALASRTT